jgi:predicted lipid-binding transport protein (Tim44 family)
MVNSRRAQHLVSVFAVLALLLAFGCGDGSGPTAPSAATPTPVVPLPDFSLAGSWTGTISYSGPAPSSDPASAQFQQYGVQVEATISAPRFTGRFHGTLAGGQLFGSLTTMIENVPFGATAAGTASASTIHLVSGELRYQNLTTSGQTIDLSR